MLEVHDEFSIVRRDWSQSFKPVNAKYRVGTTYRKEVEGNREGVALYGDLCVWANLVTSQHGAVTHHDSKWMCVLSLKVEKLCDSRLEEVVSAPTINQNLQFSISDAAIDSESLRRR